MTANRFFARFFATLAVLAMVFGFSADTVFASGSGHHDYHSGGYDWHYEDYGDNDDSTCPSEGWNVTFYNYPSDNIGMNLPVSKWNKSYGDPEGKNSAWTANWYDTEFMRYQTTESDLMFGTKFFPFDSDPEELTDGHEFYFGLKAQATVIAPAEAEYSYKLYSDDDVWVYVDGELVLDNSGVHPASLKTGKITLGEGKNDLILYFAERHTSQSQLDFEFLNTSLVVLPPTSLCANNNAPVLDGIDDQSIDELDTLLFPIKATDADGDELEYQITDGAEPGMELDSATGEFTWTPSEEQGPGSYTVTIEVSDGKGGVDSKTFVIEVCEVNQAPVAEDGNVSTHVNTSFDVNMVATDSDVPANTLTYIIVDEPTNGTLGGVSGNTVTYTPNADFTGNDSFTFKVNDGTEDSDVKTISVSVDNNAPVLTDVPTNGEDNPVSIDEEVEYTFDANATDPDDDALTFSLGGGTPDGATIDPGTGVFTWTPSEEQGPGDYFVTVVVSDGALSDTQTFSVHVNEVNKAPEVADSNIATDEDTPVSDTLTATDADLPANTLTFSVVGDPAHGTITAFDANTGNYTYTPEENFTGEDSFTWVANDGVTNSSTAKVTIAVGPKNDDPIITLNGDPEVTVKTGDDFNDPGAVCTDPEDGALTPVVDDGGFDKDTAGEYIFTYTCTDSNGSTVFVKRIVVVDDDAPEDNGGGGGDPVNQKPEINLNGDPEVNITIGGDFNDPGAVCTDPEDGALTPVVNDGDFDKETLGAYTFTYTCTDSKGLSDSVTRVVTVKAPPSQNSGGGGGGTPPAAAVLIPEAFNIASNGLPQGEVLGASTSCGIYVDKYLRRGYKHNDRSAVLKLQKFLNEYEGAKIKEDGIFGFNTERALRGFQKKYQSDVLTPWGINETTGIFYLTTQTKVNNIMCPELNLPIPGNLIQFSQHPETPKN